MSTSNSINYDKINKKICCGGIKVRRFSVGRLRTNFLYIFGHFKRWKNSYKNALRRLRRNLARRNRRTKKERNSNEDRVEMGYLHSSAGIRTIAHSNSFCSEAIADCLEFIKRNSVSIDDDRKPMLKQE